MGSFLSGSTSPKPDAKMLVEHCFTLDIGLLHRNDRLYPRATGTLRWSESTTGQQLASVGYFVASGDEVNDLQLRLNYSIDGEGVYLPIRIQQTRPNYGGIRWWLTCPLISKGHPCRRRVAKLHLRNRYFGCRQCLDLAYYSSRSAHLLERALAKTWKCRSLFDDRYRLLSAEIAETP